MGEFGLAGREGLGGGRESGQARGDGGAHRERARTGVRIPEALAPHPAPQPAGPFALPGGGRQRQYGPGRAAGSGNGSDGACSERDPADGTAAGSGGSGSTAGARNAAPGSGGSLSAEARSSSRRNVRYERCSWESGLTMPECPPGSAAASGNALRAEAGGTMLSASPAYTEKGIGQLRSVISRAFTTSRSTERWTSAICSFRGRSWASCGLPRSSPRRSPSTTSEPVLGQAKSTTRRIRSRSRRGPRRAAGSGSAG